MPNTLRISSLTESAKLLDNKIAILEKKPDSKKTDADHLQLKEMWTQRTLFQTELARLRVAQQLNVSAFFGGKI